MALAKRWGTDMKEFFLVELAIVLLAAHIGGMISKKLKQPVVLGQIIVGIIMGMTLMKKTATIHDFGQIGVVLLMFVAGLETDVKELMTSIRSSSMIALGGVVLPAVLVFAGIMIVVPGESAVAALFLGIVSTATSVSISVQTLREIHRLRSKQGLMILGAAIIDDVVGIILLTLLVSMVNPSASGSVTWVILKIVGFFVIVYVAGYVLIKIFKRIKGDSDVEEAVITYSIIICFLLAFISEEFGVAAITGAYFAGVIFALTKHRHVISHEVNKVATYLFTPVFFVGIGMDIDIFAALTSLAIGSILIVLGSIGKVVGCGLGAKLTGFNQTDSLQIGIGMIPRAEVAIIVANIGMQMSILTEKHMAATVLMVLVTTLMTPTLLKWSFRDSLRATA